MEISVLILLIGTFTAISLLWFATNKKNYNKTVHEYGEAKAKQIFKKIKICGYISLIATFLYLIFILT